MFLLIVANVLEIVLDVFIKSCECFRNSSGCFWNSSECLRNSSECFRNSSGKGPMSSPKSLLKRPINLINYMPYTVFLQIERDDDAPHKPPRAEQTSQVSLCLQHHRGLGWMTWLLVPATRAKETGSTFLAEGVMGTAHQTRGACARCIGNWTCLQGSVIKKSCQ